MDYSDRFEVTVMPKGRPKQRVPLELVQPTIPFRQITIRPPGWSIDIPIALDESENRYWPLGILCDWLGLDRSGQRRKLRTNRRFIDFLRFFQLDFGSNNVQPSWTIREDKVGKWIDTIDDAYVKEQLQPQVREFQEKITQYADFALRGMQPDRSLVQTLSDEDLDVLNDPRIRSVFRKIGLDLDMLKFAFLQQNTRLGNVEHQLSLITGMQQQLGIIAPPPTTSYVESDEEDGDDEGDE
jgi:hypothetical protein